MYKTATKFSIFFWHLVQHWRWRQPNLTTKSQRTVTKSANNNNNKYIYRDFRKVVQFPQRIHRYAIRFVYFHCRCVLTFYYYILLLHLRVSFFVVRLVWRSCCYNCCSMFVAFGVTGGVLPVAFVNTLTHSVSYTHIHFELGNALFNFFLADGDDSTEKGNIENKNPLYSK